MPSVDLLSNKRPLRIGISGAGPGGLGAALFLNQINDLVGSEDGRKEVDIQLFDQARELREVGAVSCLPPFFPSTPRGHRCLLTRRSTSAYLILTSVNLAGYPPQFQHLFHAQSTRLGSPDD